MRAKQSTMTSMRKEHHVAKKSKSVLPPQSTVRKSRLLKQNIDDNHSRVRVEGAGKVLPPAVVTTRFNDDTYCENRLFCKKMQCACIYTAPNEMPSHIHHKNYVFVIEMNNSTNTICGIGMIENKQCQSSEFSNIYQNSCSRQFVYIGRQQLARDVLVKENADLIHTLETLLFKGKTHSKRGRGFTSIPPSLLNKTKYVNAATVGTAIKRIFLDVIAANAPPENV